VFLWLGPHDWVIKRQISCPSGSLIAGFPNWKNVKITFFQQETSFSAGKYERKLPEKIPEFPLGSIYLDINFKIFHWNHNKWKNNTEIVKILNFRAKNPAIQMWYEKSADVRLFGMSPTTTMDKPPFWETTFFLWHCVIWRRSFHQVVSQMRVMTVVIWMIPCSHLAPKPKTDAVRILHLRARCVAV